MSSVRTRIVVVEEDPILRSLLQELLTAEGYAVFPHGRGADAHLLVRDIRPRAVVLDLRLTGDPDPDASGWQVLDRLVLDPATRAIPVVLTSGAVEAIAARRPALLPQHGVHVLLKPYGLNQLLAVLAEAVRQRRVGTPRDGRRAGHLGLVQGRRAPGHAHVA